MTVTIVRIECTNVLNFGSIRATSINKFCQKCYISILFIFNAEQFGAIRFKVRSVGFELCTLKKFIRKVHRKP